MRSELFRQEVITNRKQSMFGEIFLAQPFSFRVITLIIAILFFLTLLFLWLTPYQSTQTLTGQLVQGDKGLQGELAVPLKLLEQLPVGKTVQLAYTDYPADEFGYHSARVNGEGRLNLSAQGPVYLVPVALENTSLTAYNRELPLRPEMKVQAIVADPEQTLLSWLFKRSG